MKNIIEVAQLVQVCGKIEGRVKLQKIVHILQEAGCPFREEFGYLHHGPYSSDLKREIDQLHEWGLVEEAAGPVIQYTQYTYSATDKLAKSLKELNVSEQPDWRSLAVDLNKKCSSELEAISTILFLMRRNFDSEKLKERFTQLKPHLADRFEVCLDQAVKLSKRAA